MGSAAIGDTAGRFLLPAFGTADGRDGDLSFTLSADESPDVSRKNPTPFPEDGFTALENGVRGSGLKMQVVLNKAKIGRKGISRPENLAISRRVYLLERENRKIFHDEELHEHIILLMISLLLTPDQRPEPFYMEVEQSEETDNANIPFLLHVHVNHDGNAAMIPLVCDRVQDLGEGAVVLWRLLCRKLFDGQIYAKKEKIAQGAYGSVYRSSVDLAEGGEHVVSAVAVSEGSIHFLTFPILLLRIGQVAIKEVPVPRSIHDRNTLVDIFTEIQILKQFRGDRRVVHLYDYGVDNDCYSLVMKWYPASLKQWRAKQTASTSDNLLLYATVRFHTLCLLFLWRIAWAVGSMRVDMGAGGNADFWRHLGELPHASCAADRAF